MSAIVVGVTPSTPAVVLDAAVRYADAFNAELICAYVDQSRYVTTTRDGSQVSMSIDSDLVDEGGRIPDAVTQMVLSRWEGRARWSARLLAGDPATALAGLADEVDAVMLVVGTRAATIHATLAEFFSGSVAVRLAHRQHRPVLVVPVAPIPDGPLPWERPSSEVTE
jgi:nucleotide-binding universal stress UspA family protein